MTEIFKKVILTGAGFSVPWGAPTAAEFSAILLNRCRPESTQIRECLLRNNNYESALDELDRFDAKDLTSFGSEFRLLVADYFHELDERNLRTVVNRFNFEGRFLNFLNTTIENADSKAVIFATLNQDTVLERMWSKKDERYGVRGKRPTTEYRPWIAGVGRWQKGNFGEHKSKLDIIELSEEDSGHLCSLSPGLNYLKLHGSHDWTLRGEHVMVTGGPKEDKLRDHPILGRLQEILKRVLSENQCEIMLIGLSMDDHHVSQLVVDSVKKSNSSLTIWNPNAKEIASNLIRDYTLPVAQLKLIPATFEEAISGDGRIGPARADHWLRMLQEYFDTWSLTSWNSQ